ncbi:MAG TPA: GNAT family N-acetyltransferase [Solirubrobacteraceae bacterium]|nr:GNAT family N-acetyltransferase [Solirubrobacteraceae bacterium]
MAISLETVEYQRLGSPGDYAQLQDFSCGHGGYDLEVSLLVLQLYIGAGKTPGTDPFVVMRGGHRRMAGAPTVIVARTAKEVIGVSAYHLRPLYPIEGAGDEAYIWVIGIAAGHQGKGNGKRLLGRTMELIAEDWRHVPDIWALVSQGNAPSHALFRSCGFTLLPPEKEGDDYVRLRASAPLLSG